MANAPKGNAVVGQSGGPTGVINASLVGVVEEAKKHLEIENIYGAVHAVSGMVKDQFVDLGKLSPTKLDVIAKSPSSALGLPLGAQGQPPLSRSRPCSRLGLDRHPRPTDRWRAAHRCS